MVSHFRSLHGWYAVALGQSLHAWIELHVGAVRWDGVRNLTSHNFALLVLRVRAEGESKWSFSSQLWVQSKSVLFFILPASGKPDARLRRRRYDVEAKLELSRPQTNGPLSSSLRTSTQIHADSSSTAHSGRRSAKQTERHKNKTSWNERRRSRPELGCSCFPKPHVFLSDRSQQAARGRPQIMRDRRHGNWSSSCLEVPRPMSRSLWPFRAMALFWSLNPMCHALNSTGRVVKHGVLQLLWMNQLALPNVLQLLSCKCQLRQDPPPPWGYFSHLWS